MGTDIAAGSSIVSWAPIPQLDCLAQSEYRRRCLVLWQPDIGHALLTYRGGLSLCE